jgi:hypothetical protein
MSIQRKNYLAIAQMIHATYKWFICYTNDQNTNAPLRRRMLWDDEKWGPEGLVNLIEQADFDEEFALVHPTCARAPEKRDIDLRDDELVVIIKKKPLVRGSSPTIVFVNIHNGNNDPAHGMLDWTRQDAKGFRELLLKGDYTAPSKLLYKTAKEQTNRGCTPASARRYAQAAMEQEKQVIKNM